MRRRKTTRARRKQKGSLGRPAQPQVAARKAQRKALWRRRATLSRAAPSRYLTRMRIVATLSHPAAREARTCHAMVAPLERSFWLASLE